MYVSLFSGFTYTLNLSTAVALVHVTYALSSQPCAFVIVISGSVAGSTVAAGACVGVSVAAAAVADGSVVDDGLVVVVGSVVGVVVPPPV